MHPLLHKSLIIFLSIAGVIRLIEMTSICFILESDGLVVQINTTAGEDRRLDISVLFHLHPHYPSSPPDISVSSTGLSRNQCCSIRQKLLDQAAALAPQPMVHQLMECVQVNREAV